MPPRATTATPGSMKLKLILCMSVVLAAGSFCKKSAGGDDSMGGKSPEEFAKEFSEGMCTKMLECQNKQLEGMPANVREMAKSQLMTMEKCRAMVKNPAGKAEGDDTWTKMSAAERAKAMACMKAMPKASCENIMKNAVPECVEWQKIAASKRGS